jgi:hypothetical protein
MMFHFAKAEPVTRADALGRFIKQVNQAIEQARRLDPRSLADALDRAAQGLRIQDAVTRPW